jgi:glycosyltransferase involved in cell wall biosynthesis
VLPNGVDTALFAEAEPAPRGDPRLTFGFVGGLRPWHGIGDMAAAFDRVAEALDARLLVIGDGPERARLDALRDRHPDRVAVTGAVPQAEVPPLLRSVDVALAPYPATERFYFSPLKVLEYMAAGRAVIGSRIGQVGELIEDGRTGLLVPPGDAEALAGAMRRLAADPALRRCLGQAAAAEARERHDWSRRAQEILRIAGELGARG